MKWPAVEYSPIGVDLGAIGIKAVQFRMDRSGPTLVRAARVPRVKSDRICSADDVDRLLSTLWRMDFHGTRVVISVPDTRVLRSVMELPPRSSGAPLNTIARHELARTCKVDPSAMEMTLWELPGGARASEGTHVMAFGCRHDDSDALLDAFEHAGADVLAIEAPALALIRAVAPRLPAAPALTGIANLSWSAAELIIAHGDHIVYERCIKELGLDALASQIIAKAAIEADAARFLLQRVGCAEHHPIDIDPAQIRIVHGIVAAHADAFASDLAMSIDYAARRFGSSPSLCMLTGGGAMIPGFALRAGQSLHTPIVALNVSDLYSVDEACLALCRTAPMLTAAGLALHPLVAEAAA